MKEPFFERKLELVRGDKEGEETVQELTTHLHLLMRKHSCGIDKEPQWCVWGADKDGGKGILAFVKPEEGSEFMARKIAQLINKLGGNARAEMTEWNEDLEGDPIYKREDVLD